MSETHSPKETLDAAGHDRLAAYLERVKDGLEAVETAHPWWRIEHLWNLADFTFHSLKQALEDPASPVTWEEPSGTVKRLVAFDWNLWQEERDEAFGVEVTAEDLETPETKLAKGLEILSALMDWELLTELTHDVAVLRRQGKEAVFLPDDLEQEFPEDEEEREDFLEEVTAPRLVTVDTFDSLSTVHSAAALAAAKKELALAKEAVARTKEELIAKYGEGFTDEEENDETLGEELGDLDNDQPLHHHLADIELFTVAGMGREDGWRMVFFFDVAPLVIDEDAHEAYWPLSATIQLLRSQGGQEEVETYEEVLSPPPEDVSAALWEDLFRFIHEWRQEFAITPAFFRKEVDAERHSEPMTPADRSPPEPPRYLLDGPTRIDRNALATLSATSSLRLPKKWSRVRKWEDLAREEVARLLDTHGEGAFEDGLLVRKSKRGGTEEVIALTPSGEAELLEREGPKGFRRVYRDAGLGREYLVKRLRSGSGWVEARLSWSGSAGLLVADVLDKTRRDLKALQKELQRPTLFEDLDADDRERVDGKLRFLEHVRDAGPVMEYILRRFGHDGLNPLVVPAYELRTLLQCEQDEHGHRRVVGCLQALQELRFHVVTTGDAARENTFGAFLYEVKEISRGPGRHTDGDFILTISPAAVGCLKVFETSKGKLPGKLSKEATRHDFGKTLSKEEKAALSYVKSSSVVVPFFDKAAGLTPEQTRLRNWLEHNLTTNGDTAAGGRKKLVDRRSEDASRPRIYQQDFYPLLPPSRDFYAALGHSRRHAEKGWRLVQAETWGTKTGGAKHEGLLGVMGYEYPPGRAAARREKSVRLALADMKKLVVELLGGVVAAKYGGKWMSLEEAATNLTPEDLARKASWYLFVPADWQERMAAAIESHADARHARGETDYPLRVTKDRGLYERSQEDRGLPLQGEPVEGGDVDEKSPLSFRQRLRAARIAKGLKQAEVAALFEVSQQAYGAWETGKKPVPPRLAHLLEKWVVDGEVPTPEELSEET